MTSPGLTRCQPAGSLSTTFALNVPSLCLTVLNLPSSSNRANDTIPVASDSYWLMAFATSSMEFEMSCMEFATSRVEFAVCSPQFATSSIDFVASTEEFAVGRVQFAVGCVARR